MGLLTDFLAGGCGGLCLLAVGHPFDTLKVRVQTQPEIYKNAMSALRLTISREGPTALYKGVGALAPGIAPVFALSFAGYAHGKQLFGSDTYGGIMAAGFWSAFFTTPLIGPGERVKCVTQTTTKYGTGVVDVFKGLYKEGGLRTVGRGMEMTLLRDGFGGMFYYGVYEILKQNYLKANNLKDEELPFYMPILFGGCGGIGMWLAAMPLDNIKSRYQVAPEGTSLGSVIGEVRNEMKTQGMKPLYRGLGVTLARAFPANAACFFGYEQSKKALSKVLD